MLLPDLQREMKVALGRLTPNEGLAQTAIDGVTVMRTRTPNVRKPVMAEPCVVIVCGGQKRGYLGDEVYVYDQDNFLLLTVPMPFESETVASDAEPLLAVAVRLDLGVAAEIAHAMAPPAADAVAAAEGIASTPLDVGLAGSVLRVLHALENADEARVLGPALVREVCFRVLAGARGGALRSALARRGAFGQIASALRRIHADYRDNRLDVGTLAHEANLSSAAFHAQFKRVTSTSPMQYLKATRLHKARMLMIQDGVSASRAADRVGYESASQFSREFKRLFGRTPMEEIRAIHDTYGGPREPRDQP